MKELFVALLFVITNLANSQEFGIINDPDRYVNVRSGASGSHEVIGKIEEATKFSYWPDSNSSWWKIKGATKSGFALEGYMHKSRIQPYYSDELGCGCYVDYLDNERPFFEAKIGNSTISICGWLLQKESSNKVLASEFHVFECGKEKDLLFIGAVDECYIEKIDGDLRITFLKFLPFGKDYSFIRWPVSTMSIKDEADELVVSDIQFDFKVPKWDPAKIQQSIREAKAQKDKNYEDNVSYETIIINLAIGTIQGNTEALNIFNSLESQYFGFVIDGHLREQYNYFKSLVDKSLSKKN